MSRFVQNAGSVDGGRLKILGESRNPGRRVLASEGASYDASLGHAWVTDVPHSTAEREVFCFWGDCASTWSRNAFLSGSHNRIFDFSFDGGTNMSPNGIIIGHMG